MALSAVPISRKSMGLHSFWLEGGGAWGGKLPHCGQDRGPQKVEHAVPGISVAASPDELMDSSVCRLGY